MLEKLLLDCELSESVKADIVGGVPGSTLVFYAPALHGRGGTLIDRSANGNNGTISGPTWVRLPRGLRVLNYNGSTDYVQMAYSASLAITAAITVAMWVKLDAVSGSQCFYARGKADASKFGMLFQASDNAIQLCISPLATWTIITSTGLITAVWWHVACTWDGTTMRIYRNGVVDATTGTFSSTIETDAADRHRFGMAPWGGQALAGKIVLPVIYSRALSATELLRLHTRQRHLFGV